MGVSFSSIRGVAVNWWQGDDEVDAAAIDVSAAHRHQHRRLSLAEKASVPTAALIDLPRTKDGDNPAQEPKHDDDDNSNSSSMVSDGGKTTTLSAIINKMDARAPSARSTRRRSVVDALRYRNQVRWRELSVTLTRTDFGDSFGIELERTSGHVVELSASAEAAGVRLLDALIRVNDESTGSDHISDQIAGQLEVHLTLLRPPDAMLEPIALETGLGALSLWLRAVAAAAAGDADALFDSLAGLAIETQTTEREVASTRKVTELEAAALLATDHVTVEAGHTLREVAERAGRDAVVTDLTTLSRLDDAAISAEELCITAADARAVDGAETETAQDTGEADEEEDGVPLSLPSPLRPPRLSESSDGSSTRTSSRRGSLDL